MLVTSMKLDLQIFGDVRFGHRLPEVPYSAKVSSEDWEKVGPDIEGSIPASGYYFFSCRKKVIKEVILRNSHHKRS